MAFALVAYLSSELVRAETMGELSFAAPKGWRAECRSFWVYVCAADPGRSCNAMLVSSTARKGTRQGEFDDAWRQIAISPEVVGQPAITQSAKNGCAVTTGVSKVERGKGTFLLSTRTDSGRTSNLWSYMGDEPCPAEVARLLDSVELIRMTDVKASRHSGSSLPSDLDRMVGHNSFAVTAKGLDMARPKDGPGDGTYKGRLVTTSEDLKKSSDDAVRGTYTLSGSEITAANWAAGKSKRFRAKLSVLKHGPQLTLMDLDDPASEYVLSRYW